MPTTASETKHAKDAAAVTAFRLVIAGTAVVVLGAAGLLVVRGDALLLDLANGWSAIVACF